MTRLTLVGTPTVVAVSAADPTPDNSGFGELPGMIIGTRDLGSSAGRKGRPPLRLPAGPQGRLGGIMTISN